MGNFMRALIVAPEVQTTPYTSVLAIDEERGDEFFSGFGFHT